MRTETLWQGQRRAARMHWLREVLDRPKMEAWDEILDEMVRLRFGLPAETSVLAPAEGCVSTSMRF